MDTSLMPRFTIWTNGSIPENYFGVYVMKSEAKGVCRIGAFGSKAKKADDGQPIALGTCEALKRRISNCNTGKTRAGKPWSLLFVAVVSKADFFNLLKIEAYLQGRLYRKYTYVGNSIIDESNFQSVQLDAVNAINDLEKDSSLIDNIWQHAP